MKRTFILILLASSLFAQEKIIMGITTVVTTDLIEKRLSSFIAHIEKETGKSVEIQAGLDYKDTIQKFADGYYDIGFIGPIPYIKTLQNTPNSVKIVAGVKEMQPVAFQTAIVVKKGSPIKKLQDLEQKRFAFGSPQSTLSFYIPFMMLQESDVLTKLARYDFLGRHDRVVQYVIMGKYDAGALMHSIARKYSQYIDIIALSEPTPNFSIVVSSKLDAKLQRKIEEATKTFKENEFFGLEKREDADYDYLRELMLQVDNFTKK